MIRGDRRLKYHTCRNPYTEVLFAKGKEPCAKETGRRHSENVINVNTVLPPPLLSRSLSFSPPFFGMPSGNTYDRDERLAITALNRFTREVERGGEQARERRKERQRGLADSGEKSGETVGPHWLRLDDLAFLGEETRGDLGSRPPLRRYGYAEVSDNGTSSTLPPAVLPFLPPCSGRRFLLLLLFLVFQRRCARA